jgi:hypothetical protein
MVGRLVAVTNPEEIATLQAMAQPLLEPHGILSAKWPATREWLAMPVESACHFDDRDAQLLAEAMVRFGGSTCFAIATEQLASLPRCFRVDVSAEGLRTFSRECAHFNFVLLPACLSFAVLCTVFDYFVVAGPKSFVESAVGSTIIEAKERFFEFSSSSEESTALIAVARYYAGA